MLRKHPHSAHVYQLLYIAWFDQKVSKSFLTRLGPNTNYISGTWFDPSGYAIHYATLQNSLGNLFPLFFLANKHAFHSQRLWLTIFQVGVIQGIMYTLHVMLVKISFSWKFSLIKSNILYISVCLKITLLIVWYLK